MNKNNTRVGIVLMVLMLLNFWLAELSPIDDHWIMYTVLLITGIKFLSIAFQFMDLKDAHRGWKRIIVVFALVFIGLAILL